MEGKNVQGIAMLAGETKFKGESFGCNAWVMPSCFVASDDMGSVNAINMEVVYATNAGASCNCLNLQFGQHSIVGRIWLEGLADGLVAHNKKAYN